MHDAWGQIIHTSKRPMSSWTVRVFKSNRRHHGSFRQMPSIGALDYVGEGTTQFINFRHRWHLRRLINGTPHYSFMTAIYGNLRVRKAGVYNFCTTSSDGSRLYIGGTSSDKEVVNNGGTHGWRKRCNTRNLVAGTHQVILLSFKGRTGGGMTIQAQYSGPDTDNNMMFIRSDDAVSHLPPKPKASKWAVMTFSSSVGLRVRQKSVAMRGAGEEDTSNVLKRAC